MLTILYGLVSPIGCILHRRLIRQGPLYVCLHLPDWNNLAESLYEEVGFYVVLRQTEVIFTSLLYFSLLCLQAFSDLCRPNGSISSYVSTFFLLIAIYQLLFLVYNKWLHFVLFVQDCNILKFRMCKYDDSICVFLVHFQFFKTNSL